MCDYKLEEAMVRIDSLYSFLLVNLRLERAWLEVTEVSYSMKLFFQPNRRTEVHHSVFDINRNSLILALA